MKRGMIILGLVILISGIAISQTASQDSATIKQLEADKAKLNQQIGELTRRNTAIENAFITEYLNQQGKQAGKAFVDQYLYIQQLRRDVKIAADALQYYKTVTNDFARIKNMKEWEQVMKKHNIPRPGKD